MNFRISGSLAIGAFVVACLLGSAQSLAQNAYVPMSDNTVSVIDTATNTVTATIAVGLSPSGVGVGPDASKVYVANTDSNTVSVIDTATNTVTGTIPVGVSPFGVAVTPDDSKVYVANTDIAHPSGIIGPGTVSVIDTATNTVTVTIPVGSDPNGVAVTPDGAKVYVANAFSNTVSVIATATNTVTTTIPAVVPAGVAVTPDGTKVYVTNSIEFGTVSVIATATDTVIATIPLHAGAASASGVAVTPDGAKVYVANAFSNTVSVIATATNTVTTTIPAVVPAGVAVTPDGTKVYVTNSIEFGTVSVIATATDTVIATIPLHAGAASASGVAVTPDGTKVYVVDADLTGLVSVIATATDTVIGSPIAVGINPSGVAVTPDGTKVYVVNYVENLRGATNGSVSVIATATDTVTATIPVAAQAGAFGIFIQPLILLRTSEVAAAASGLAYSRVTRTFNGTVTITNISSSAISGPFQMVLTGLTAGVTLADATGEFSGSPYLTITVPSLAPGRSATVNVQFENPSFGRIKFTPVIYSGSI